MDSTLKSDVDSPNRQPPPRASFIPPSDLRFRKLIESDLVGIACGDKNGLMAYANDRFLALVGYTRADLRRGRLRWDRMTPAEYEARDREGMADAVRLWGGSPMTIRFAPSGGGRWTASSRRSLSPTVFRTA